MFYKIPIYFEVTVDGDFNPSVLSESVDDILTGRIYNIIKESFGTCLDSENDMFDSTALKIRRKTKTKRVKIKLVKRSQVIKGL